MAEQFRNKKGQKRVNTQKNGYKNRIRVLLFLLGSALAAAQLCYAQEPLCIFTVDPKILYFEPEGGTQQATVTASSPGCSFTPRTAYRWITASSSEELGKRVIVIQVGPAPNLAQRVGSVMIGTTQIEVVQRARDHLSW